jgi:hypothetical protein
MQGIDLLNRDNGRYGLAYTNTAFWGLKSRRRGGIALRSRVALV